MNVDLAYFLYNSFKRDLVITLVSRLILSSSSHLGSRDEIHAADSSSWPAKLRHRDSSLELIISQNSFVNLQLQQNTDWLELRLKSKH